MLNESFHLFDIIALITVVLSTLYGLWRGFIKETISLIIWFLIFFIAINYIRPISYSLQPYIKHQHLTVILTSVALVLISLLVGLFINLLLSYLIDLLPCHLINHVMGALLGLARGIILISLLVWILANTSLRQESWFAHSSTAHQLQILDFPDRQH